MKIISYKSGFVSRKDFIDQVLEKDYIEGVYLDIIMTKDDKIAAFNLGNISIIDNEVIQGSNLSELREPSIVGLEEVLTLLKGFKKRIILFLTPLVLPPLSDETIKEINRINWKYTSTVTRIIEKYSDLDISVTTTNVFLLTYLKQQSSSFKKGLTLLANNPTYVDTDFYIFPAAILDAKIMLQELKDGKEVMIRLFSSSEEQVTLDFFNNMSEDVRYIFERAFFVTDYPAIIYSLLSSSIK